MQCVSSPCFNSELGVRPPSFLWWACRAAYSYMMNLDPAVQPTAFPCWRTVYTPYHIPYGHADPHDIVFGRPTAVIGTS